MLKDIQIRHISLVFSSTGTNSWIKVKGEFHYDTNPERTYQLSELWEESLVRSLYDNLGEVLRLSPALSSSILNWDY